MTRRRIVTPGVIGIDLSLQRSAAVYLPADWEPGSWVGVEWKVAGSSVEGKDPEKQTARLSEIVGCLSKFVKERGVVDVYLEDAVFGLAGRGGIWLAELAGAVKVTLYGMSVLARPVNVATVRKTFLGTKMPRKGAAGEVQRYLKLLDWPHESSDEGDALIVANHGRSLLGMSFMTVSEL